MVVNVVDRWIIIEESTYQKHQEDCYVMSMMVTKLLSADVSYKVDDGSEIMMHGRS